MLRKFGAAAIVAGCLSLPAGAADLIIIPPTVIEPDLFSWTSCYVGVHLNYDKASVDAVAPFGLSDYSTEATGPGVGGQLGCDFQLDDSPIVLGVVVDATWQNKTGSSDIPVTGGPAQTLNTDVPLIATLRARAGVAADTTLFYLTGGLAYAHVRNNLVVGTTYDETVSANHFGWTAGLGLETYVTENITIFAEYLYADLGEQDYTFPAPASFGTTDTLTYNVIDHSVKVGLNFRF